MQTRRLGESELEIPTVVMGCWAIGGSGWGGSDDGEARDAIRAALDLGGAALDTAPIYGRGRSERVVGEAIAGRRDEVLLFTKVGLRWDCTDGHLAIKAKDDNGDPLMIYFNGRPESVRREVEQSLTRLGTDYIDLLQVHWPDPTTPIEETMGALVDLVHEGKLRAVGVSNFTPEQMDEARAALGDVPLASDQPRYSLVRREIEADVLPYARERNVGLLVYSPLEQGLLTGKVPADRVFGKDDARHKRDTFTPENRARVNAILGEVVQPIAERVDGTLAQTCLAWLLAQAGVTAVLAGARRAEQVRENAHAAALELTADELAAIDQAFAGLELEA